jgi:hypothetical protein
MPHDEITHPDDEQQSAEVTPLQWTLAGFTMALTTMVVTTALYGTKEQSERAFRLLPWLKRDPKPTPGQDTDSTQQE